MSTRWLVSADDPTISHRDFIDLLERTRNPRQRRILETVIRHDRAEADRDMERVMATLSPEPVYRRWGATGDTGPKGTEAVRAHYEAMFARGGIGNLTVKRETIVMDDGAIAIEHRVSHIWPWRLAEEAGYKVPERQGHYACHVHLATLISFDDDALIIGETSYGFPPSPIDFEPVADDELSPGYLNWLRQFRPESATG